MILLDASALLPLFIKEDQSASAEAFRDANVGSIAVSDYAAGEVASALARLVRMQRHQSEAMRAAWSAFDRWRAADTYTITIDAGDIRRATNFVLDWRLQLRLPDAVHLSLATRLAVPFVTLDRRLIDAGRRLNIEMMSF